MSFGLNRFQYQPRERLPHLQAGSRFAALYDSDWELELPGEVPGSIEKFSFRRILAVRFGIDNISNKEIQNIPLGTLRAELIKEAKEYWCNRKLSVVEPLDFISFAGEAYTVWRVKKGEDCSDDDGNFVDHENKIAYLPEGRDSKATSIAFVRLALEILNYHRSYYYCSEQLDSLSEDLWELLRMNNCFRGEVVKEKEKPSLD